MRSTITIMIAFALMVTVMLWLNVHLEGVLWCDSCSGTSNHAYTKVIKMGDKR